MTPTSTRRLPRRPGSWRRTLVVVVAGAVLGAGGAIALPALAQDTAPPATKPSEPPFWARPRPPAPTVVCEDPVAAAPPPASQRPAVATGLASGGAVVLLFALWRRFARRPERDDAASPPAVAAVAPPAPPPADGLDPRARARAAKAAGAPAPSPAEDLEDLRAMTVELAQPEPEGESAGAKAFYSEIATSLQAALRKDPARQDLRRKLLEIHFSGQQVNEFVNLAHEYLDQNHGYRDQFWTAIGTMGARLAPDHELFAEWAAAGARPAARRVVQLRRFHERNVDQGKLYTAQQALVADFQKLRADPAFHASLGQLLADGVRRPAPLTPSPELSYVADGAQIYVKHEDRRRFHDDIMINVMGQILVAQRLGRTRVVTATRDGILGHAVAGAAARLGIDCTIYIAERDLQRYYARVLSMRRLGAHLRPIPGADAPDARRAALDAWLDEPAQVQYVSGLTGGPPPYPDMVREFLSVVGRETLDQMQSVAGGPPSAVVAGVCDGHMGLGLLAGLLDHAQIQLYCVEEKPPAPDPASGSLPNPRSGGQLTRREHGWLRETGRVNYVTGDDPETLRIIEQFHATGTTLFTESARTMAHARSLARRLDRRQSVVVLLTNQEGADFRGQRHEW